MQKIKDLREYVVMACATMLSSINSATVGNIDEVIKRQFSALQQDIDIHLTGIEKEITVSQSAATSTSTLAPARQWHYIVLSGGTMFTAGLLLGAYLFTLGAVG